MPSNPLDNVPEAFRRQVIATDKLPTASAEPQMNGHSNFGGPLMPSGHQEKLISMNSSATQEMVNTDIFHLCTSCCDPSPLQ